MAILGYITETRAVVVRLPNTCNKSSDHERALASLRYHLFTVVQNHASNIDLFMITLQRGRVSGTSRSAGQRALLPSVRTFAACDAAAALARIGGLGLQDVREPTLGAARARATLELEAHAAARAVVARLLTVLRAVPRLAAVEARRLLALLRAVPRLAAGEASRPRQPLRRRAPLAGGLAEARLLRLGALGTPRPPPLVPLGAEPLLLRR
eukprot:CAMPEP_0205883732 /NCGR_PEP_ID=MMETSP1083-20121108/17706_1 /ASSEMBLY_ACC=CAM_ASM_000430 /TAXON_ID=97485 /ORGANISM="Prymnesium parvum, Strain Texoma1" /LENGTH=210 /DNA_ID=CAMNT_0053247015 /DNA_START=574 /DNA_END=1204 /DNA_ORIENTATION=-